jgi:hypothetical protein
MRLRSLLSLLLVAQLLAPGIGRASVEFLCEMDNAVHRSCCCENGMRAERRCARVEQADCCTLRPGAEQPATRSDAAPVVTPLLIEVAAATRVAAADAGRRCMVTGPGGAVGPPIFLRNCTILR